MDDIKGFQGEYRFLSNFFSVPITILGVDYRSTEAAYQAAKSRSMETRARFSHLDPVNAKRLGREILLRDDWNDMTKVEVMELVLRAKFMIPSMRKRLLATGTADLIEDNNWGDRFWGMVKGHGSNMLGKLLMNIRADLNKYHV